VVAVDVGRGQLDAALRADPRVEAHEGLNARHLRPGDLPGPPALVVIDVSFISLAKIVLAVAAAAPGAEVVALVKPQFEVGRGRVGRGGVVRDPALQEEVLRGVCARSADWGLRAAAIVESPLRGAEGNREFFVRWTPVASGPAGALDVERAIREAVHGGG
jgi:23S rRNA (cytidine1920-2'-O)/16S rRNA (cytidine1409-2'-O)-methyltransferase